MNSEDAYLPYSPLFFGTISFIDRTSSYRSYPVDFHENPSRSIALCRELEKTIVNPVAGTALSLTCDFALSSAEGDEFGIAVTIPENSGLSQRRSALLQKTVNNLISGFTLDDYWRICWRFLAWGDCFASVFQSEDGSLKPILLPTWQIHIDVNEQNGDIAKIRQVRPGETEIEIDSEHFIQWSYRKNFVYGRSLFYEVRDAAESYTRNSEDITQSSRNAAIVPNIHIMPEGSSPQYLEAYRTDHKAQQRQGVISDIYLPFGGDMKKPFGGVQQFPLDAMLKAAQFRRLEIAVASRVPLYILGIEYRSAREISLQPAMTFRLHIGRVRAILASGLKQIVDRYLKESDFPTPYNYRFQFPKIDLNPFEQVKNEDVNAEGVTDLD